MTLTWRRVLTTLVVSALLGLVISAGFLTSTLGVVARVAVVGMFVLLVFSLFERWPAKLPRWLARWVLQVLGVALAVPIGVLLLYFLLQGDKGVFWQDSKRINGVLLMSFSGMLVAPWVAMSTLLRQRDDAVRAQALSFATERSELERQAVDARLRLLQAQVEPHFLFNTLANVRELVDSGSPQASTVLESLIDYLRAAVPRLHEPATTMGQELQLVRAYLALMHLRMPDRLEFALEVDAAAEAVHCPPMTLLTLVENAVRHGIDPSMEGGRIDVRVRLHGGRCLVQVIDTGMGLGAATPGLGTGLSTLRERLQLVFGGDAQLRLVERQPRGVCAELDFPARTMP